MLPKYGNSLDGPFTNSLFMQKASFNWLTISFYGLRNRNLEKGSELPEKKILVGLLILS